MPFALTRQTRMSAGIFLLALLTVEFGGYYLEGVVTDSQSVTDFELAFARAGHAHAGVLVMLGLIGLLYADAARLSGVTGVIGRYGIFAGALFMSGGFFLSSAGEGRTEPNGLIVLLWIGALSLAAGLVTLALGLFRSSNDREMAVTS